jgi:hypothetical protein
MKKQSLILSTSLLVSVFLFLLPTVSAAVDLKAVSIRTAKILAEDALVASISALKGRPSESLEDRVEASFEGKNASKIEALSLGIKFEEVAYDAEKDIAKVTAAVSLDSLATFDGPAINLQGKIFRRVAFASSTLSQQCPLRALRAAELDAYKQLLKRISALTTPGGKTSVQDYMLFSSTMKTKVLASIFVAKVKDYGWNEDGVAFIKMNAVAKDVVDLLGMDIGEKERIIEVEGFGRQKR